MEAFGVAFHLFLDRSAGAVGGTVVHDQDMGIFQSRHYGGNYVVNILYFVVSWDDDEGLIHYALRLFLESENQILTYKSLFCERGKDEPFI